VIAHIDFNASLKSIEFITKEKTMRTISLHQARWLWLLTTLTLSLAAVPVSAQETNKDTAASQFLGVVGRPAAQTAEEMLALAASDLLVLAERDPANDLLGAKFTALTETQRAQLGIPAGEGLLVSALQKNGPSAAAGLKQHDILLRLGDRTLAEPDDLSKHLKAAGDSPIPLKLLRGGKHVTLKVRPIYRVTLGPVGQEKKEYYIGVSLGAPDEALRSHLNVPAGKGVIVNSIVEKSPAETAGVKKHDIILEYGGKAIETPEMLSAEVQAGQDRPSTLLVLREGKPMKIPVTAASRDVVAEIRVSDKLLRLWSLQNGQPRTVETWLGGREAAVPRAEEDRFARERKDWLDREAKLAQQLDDLRYQVRALAEAVERLNSATKGRDAKK
jgi:membrane-associated protease RseP (regulator of RpoE activity)